MFASPARYLILGILDEAVAGVVRHWQQGLTAITGNWLALKFPVHITLRGPFWAGPDLDPICAALNRVCRSRGPVEVQLQGPVFVDPDLMWFEVDPSSSGFSELSALHRRFHEEVAPYAVADDVPSAHRGSDYRPHVTIGWGVDLPAICDPAVFRGPVRLAGVIGGIALAGYPRGWPHGGSVEIVECVALS